MRPLLISIVPFNKILNMETLIPDKAFFRIGEVSKILGVETYVIRYWETEFKSIRPFRTKSDQRLYRKQDLEQLLSVKNLLYQEKFTIEGARQKLSRGKDKKQHQTHQESKEEATRPVAASEQEEEGLSLNVSLNLKLIRIKSGLQEIRDLLTGYAGKR